MKNSFRLKVMFSFFVGITLSVVLLITCCKFIMQPILVFDSRRSVENYAKLVIDTYDSGSATLTRLLEMIDSSYDIQSVVYTGDYEIISNSSTDIYPNSYRMAMLRQWMEKYQQKNGGEGIYCTQLSDSADNLKRIVYIENLGGDVYLAMSKVIKGIEQEVRIVSIVIAAVGVLITLISFIVWSLLTVPFTRQMKKMSQITKNMAQLNFDEKINAKGKDEIGQLARSIDEMSDELKNSIEKLQNDVDRRKRLIRDISHELKTPITTIRGYTENIEILSPDNERIQRYCGIMVEECEVIDRLVNEMLYMSRLESDGYKMEMEELDFDKLKSTLEQKAENEYSGEKISIEFTPAVVMANFDLIVRAVSNYIVNAVRHREPGSEITVRGHAEKGRYVFSVTNEGSEIPESDRENIWDVFYKRDQSRTRGADKGHGIGLAIVKQIAVLHGGEVKVTSGENRTTFYIILPL